MSYMLIIKYALVFFPFIAFLFTAPFVLIEYHKFGSISLFKSFLVYLFVFYLLCAYFLVILPLPKISEVATLTTPRMQLVPFDFVFDFIRHSSFSLLDISTYLPALKETYFYVPVFNILLTIPFGMFLRYYFKCDLKKVVIFTFLLSLFFELTQLSGLYFIYPRGYRLFDVDDLILNTFGGFLGYFLCFPFLRIVPKIDTVNSRAKEKGKDISGFRRTVAFFLDLFLFLILYLIVIRIFGNYDVLFLSLLIVYYLVVPLFLGTSTFGERFLNIQILDYSFHRNLKRLLFRKLLFFCIYIVLPFGVCFFFFHCEGMGEFFGFIAVLIFSFVYFVSGCKYLFSGKDMFYEKLSKTRRVSTIK